MILTTIVLIIGVGCIIWRRPWWRRQVAWGAGLTVPLIAANVWLAGSLQRIGTTTNQILVELVVHLVAVSALGGILAAVYEATISRWLTSISSERRHALLWLTIGLLTSCVAVGFGVPVFLALVIGLLVNAVLVVLIDWRMFFDVVVGSLGFAVWYGIADLLFGFRVSGNITPLLLGPQPIGVTIAGLAPERIIAMAGLGCCIGSLFVAVKRYRLPNSPTSTTIPGWKVLTSSGAVIALSLAATWFTIAFVEAPTVYAITPAYGQTIQATSPIIVTFSRPVSREQLRLRVQPSIAGSWTFSQGESERHAYRTATFTPETSLTPGITYTGTITNVASLWGVRGKDANVTFTVTEPEAVPLTDSATTLPIPQAVATPEPVNIPETVAPEPPPPTIPTVQRVQLAVAQDYQDSPLSCEAASLKMALAAKGIRVSEKDIMNIVGYDPTPHQGNVWGNPHTAFVGNIAGKQNTTGYGVYWEPIARAAQHWRPAKSITNGTVTDLTTALDHGNAVVIWGTLGHAYRDDWTTPAGTSIVAWKGEHARTLIGYVGTSAHPTSFIINDPIIGRVTWTTSVLLANWSAFHQSAVVVE